MQLAVTNLFFGKSIFVGQNNKNKLATAEPATLNDLLQKDTDGDGVMDWEEALWGTDPNNPTTFNNVADSEYIKEKRIHVHLVLNNHFWICPSNQNK